MDITQGVNAMSIAEQKIKEDYAIYLGDCLELMPKMKDNSVDLMIYSPPFIMLYQYSSNERDLSNCLNKEAFHIESLIVFEHN